MYYKLQTGKSWHKSACVFCSAWKRWKLFIVISKKVLHFSVDDASHYCRYLRKNNNYAVKNLASLHLKSPSRIQKI